MPAKIWSPKQNKKKFLSKGETVRSKRPYEYAWQNAKQIQKRVLQGIILLGIIYLFYLGLFSGLFLITQFNFNNASNVPSPDIENTIKNNLNRRYLFGVPGNNYFLLNTERLKKNLNNEGLGLDLKIIKKFPHTLIIEAEKTITQAAWITNEEFYLIDFKGNIKQRLENYTITSGSLPIIYDLSNNPIQNDHLDNNQLLKLIQEAANDFTSYQLPKIQLDYFKVDSINADYIKIVAKQRFEIYVNVNYERTLRSQIDKLKKSLLSGKIDLSKLEYINLRVENQVIYK